MRVGHVSRSVSPEDHLHLAVNQDHLRHGGRVRVESPSGEVHVAEHRVGDAKLLRPRQRIRRVGAIFENRDTREAEGGMLDMEFLEIWSQTPASGSGEAAEVQQDHVTEKVVEVG